MIKFFKRHRPLRPFEYKGFRLVPTRNSVFVFTLNDDPRTKYRTTLTTVEDAKAQIDEGKVRK